MEPKEIIKHTKAALIVELINELNNKLKELGFEVKISKIKKLKP